MFGVVQHMRVKLMRSLGVAMVGGAVIAALIIQLAAGSIIHSEVLDIAHGGDSHGTWTASEIGFSVV